MERVREEDERKRRAAGVAGVGRGQAGHASPERLPADGDGLAGRRPLGEECREDGDRPLGPPARQVDGARFDPAGPQAGDVGSHRGGAPRGAVAQDDDRARPGVHQRVPGHGVGGSSGPTSRPDPEPTCFGGRRPRRSQRAVVSGATTSGAM